MQNIHTTTEINVNKAGMGQTEIVYTRHKQPGTGINLAGILAERKGKSRRLGWGRQEGPFPEKNEFFA